MTCKCCGYTPNRPGAVERRFVSMIYADVFCDVCQFWFQTTLCNLLFHPQPS